MAMLSRILRGAEHRAGQAACGQESMVIQRLEALEGAVRQLAEEMRRPPEQFREHRVAFQEYR